MCVLRSEARTLECPGFSVAVALRLAKSRAVGAVARLHARCGGQRPRGVPLALAAASYPPPLSLLLACNDSEKSVDIADSLLYTALCNFLF